MYVTNSLDNFLLISCIKNCQHTQMQYVGSINSFCSFPFWWRGLGL